MFTIFSMSSADVAMSGPLHVEHVPPSLASHGDEPQVWITIAGPLRAGAGGGGGAGVVVVESHSP